MAAYGAVAPYVAVVPPATYVPIEDYKQKLPGYYYGPIGVYVAPDPAVAYQAAADYQIRMLRYIVAELWPPVGQRWPLGRVEYAPTE